MQLAGAKGILQSCLGGHLGVWAGQMAALDTVWCPARMRSDTSVRLGAGGILHMAHARDDATATTATAAM